jgi:hypothetical protein
MGLFERGGVLRPANSWTAKAKTAEIRRKCPKVDDCPVQNARTRQPTRKERQRAAELAAQAKAAKKNKGTWPNKGKYDPGKGKARGKGK